MRIGASGPVVSCWDRRLGTTDRLHVRRFSVHRTDSPKPCEQLLWHTMGKSKTVMGAVPTLMIVAGMAANLAIKGSRDMTATTCNHLQNAAEA